MRTLGRISYEFEGFVLDLAGGSLRHAQREIELRPKSFEVLRYLVENAGRLVPKDELATAVWQNVAVTDESLTRCISDIRLALDDVDRRLIRTIPRRGYRFAATTSPIAANAASASLAETLPRSSLSLSDKPTVAVLPFKSIGRDPKQQHVADGITQDVIAALMRYPSLLVVAHGSSFPHKSQPRTDVMQVGHELRVRYVLEGTLRKAGNRICVVAQLVEIDSGTYVWAGRYDRSFTDIFTVQDDIAKAVAIAMVPAIAEAELRRATRPSQKNPEAWATYQQGLWHLYRHDAPNNALAQSYFKHAVGIDPNFAPAYKGLAVARFHAAVVLGVGLAGEAYISADICARHALALDSGDAEAVSILAAVALWSRGDYARAVTEAERARSMSPNLATTHATLGSALIFSGRPIKGVAAIETSVELDPYSPKLPCRLSMIAAGFYLDGNYEDAVETAKRCISLDSNYALAYRWLAAGLGQLDRITAAKEALEQAVAMAPSSFDMYVRHRVPWHRPVDRAHMLEGLRQAGWKG